jgi:uncharacterized 2Fe-2S/4Fe-4S cluster protein (DUF4445 family)
MSITATIISDHRQDTVEVGDDESLLGALQRTGWHLPAPCGGTGRCGKCLVALDPPEAGGTRSPEEDRFTGDDPARRLACRTYPVADLTVTLPGRVTPPASADTLAKGGGIEVPTSGKPVVVLERLRLNAPTLEDQQSVLRRMRAAAGMDDLRVACEHLSVAAAALEAGAELDTIIDTGEPALVAIERAPDRTEAGMRLLGVAFDIGTTTVAGYLVDLGSHDVLASCSEANAQGDYGADVITRITAYGAGAPLHEAICEQLASLTRQLARDADVRSEEIATAAIVGNTTMLHLLLDLDPSSMSRAPFMPVLTEGVTVPASDVCLPLHPKATLRIPPGVSAYVGTDIVADLLSSGMDRHPGVSLLVDIGTNGEIVCGGEDGLVACSTAAGPAFEGATIRHGSGGVAGAINHVRREGATLVIETIGGVAPKSICGTGLMDAVAVLLADGVVDETGRFDADAATGEAAELYRERIVEVDGEPALVLADGESAHGEPIVLTQGDVRQVQLAKGAIAAGIRVLLDEAGVEPSDLQAIYLAGGFGTYVRPLAALRVGLLPDVEPERVVAVGNAAGAGAARVLVDRASGEEAQTIVDSCRYIELSGSAAFQTFYMEEMMFPAPE